MVWEGARDGWSLIILPAITPLPPFLYGRCTFTYPVSGPCRGGFSGEKRCFGWERQLAPRRSHPLLHPFYEVLFVHLHHWPKGHFTDHVGTCGPLPLVLRATCAWFTPLCNPIRICLRSAYPACVVADMIRGFRLHTEFRQP